MVTGSWDRSRPRNQGLGGVGLAQKIRVGLQNIRKGHKRAMAEVVELVPKGAVDKARGDPEDEGRQLPAHGDRQGAEGSGGG